MRLDINFRKRVLSQVKHFKNVDQEVWIVIDPVVAEVDA